MGENARKMNLGCMAVSYWWSSSIQLSSSVWYGSLWSEKWIHGWM